MKKLFTNLKFAALPFAAVFLLFSCSKEDISEAVANQVQTESNFYKNGAEICGQSTIVNLIAGQNTIAGNVTVANDNNYVYVTYNTTNGWKIGAVHLYVGKCNLIPRTSKGNPIPGQFPYKRSFSSSGVTTTTFKILKSCLDSCFCVAAHAEVFKNNSNNNRYCGGGSNAETAWGQGTRFVQRGNWGMYFTACKQACADPCEPKPLEGCTYSPVSLFDQEGSRLETWGEANISVAGFSYSKTEVISIYEVAPNDNDAWNAFVAIAAIKISENNVAADASVRCYVAQVETWLATVGKLSPNNLPATAPQNIQPALSALLQWVEQKQCP